MSQNRIVWFLLPIAFIACNSGTNRPETKKASFNLKEACANSPYFKVPKPNRWDATISWHRPDGSELVSQIIMDWQIEGFVLPCGYGTQGDTKAMLTIYYE